MTSLAVIVSRGSSTDFIQALTILMAAVHSELKLRVLFRDEAVPRLRPDRINQFEPSAAYAQDLDGLRQRLTKHDLLDLHKLLRDIKASGDVQYYVCSSSLAVWGLKQQDLIPDIDDIRGLPAFLLEDVATSDKVLTF